MWLICLFYKGFGTLEGGRERPQGAHMGGREELTASAGSSWVVMNSEWSRASARSSWGWPRGARGAAAGSSKKLGRGSQVASENEQRTLPCGYYGF